MVGRWHLGFVSSGELGIRNMAVAGQPKQMSVSGGMLKAENVLMHIIQMQPEPIYF